MSHGLTSVNSSLANAVPLPTSSGAANAAKMSG